MNGIVRQKVNKEERNQNMKEKKIYQSDKKGMHGIRKKRKWVNEKENKAYRQYHTFTKDTKNIKIKE